MESKFQFTNPALTALDFEIDETFDNQEGQEVKIKIDMSVQVSKSTESNEAVVGLTFQLGDRNGESPFYVKATEKANFRWEDGMDDTLVEGLLKQNAPSLLLAYLRPIVVQITAASPFGAYNIPFMNFSDMK